jgi:hypothetical protein
LKIGKDNDFVLRLEYLYGDSFWELQTKLFDDGSKVIPVRKEYGGTFGYGLFPEYYEDRGRKSIFDYTHEIKPTSDKPSKYAGILGNMVRQPSRSRYSNSARLHLSFKNNEILHAEYLILEDIAEKQPYDKIAVYKANDNFVTELTRNNEYMLYVLSADTLVSKYPIKFTQPGDYFLIRDISLVSSSDSINKEIASLLNPFIGKNIVRLYVTDESGEPLPGATIKLSDVNIYAMTDIDGNAVLTLFSGFNGYIEVSYIGMETERIRYTGRPVVEVRLRQRYELLE